MERGKIITGARARLLIDGQKVGWATDVSVSETIEYQEAVVLDNIEVEEHVPVAYRVNLTFGTFTVVGKSLKRLGLMPLGGQDASVRLRNILMSGELSCAIVDSQTDTVLEMVTGVKISERNVQISAGNLSGTQVTAVARRTLDQVEL